MKRFLTILLLLVAVVSPVPGRLQFQGIMTRPGVAVSPLLTGLQAYYKLEDLTDSSGNGNTLTVATGTASFTAGKVNNAATLNGATYFAGADNARYQPGTGDWSVAVWGKTSVTTGFASPVSYGNVNAAGGGYIFLMFNGSMYAKFGDGTNVAQAGPASSIADGNWHLFILTADRAGSLSLYVDNVLAATDSLALVTGAIGPNAFYGLRVGTSDNVEYWTGQMDELALYNIVMSSTQRSLYWNGGAGTTYPF